VPITLSIPPIVGRLIIGGAIVLLALAWLIARENGGVGHVGTVETDENITAPAPADKPPAEPPAVDDAGMPPPQTIHVEAIAPSPNRGAAVAEGSGARRESITAPPQGVIDRRRLDHARHDPIAEGRAMPAHRGPAEHAPPRLERNDELAETRHDEVAFRDGIRDTVAGMRGDLRACYTSVLENDPLVEDRIVLELDLIRDPTRPNGVAVEVLSIESTSLEVDELECFHRVVADGAFPGLPGEQTSIRVRYPVHLRTGP